MKKSVLKLEVHESAPDGFTPQVEVAACYLEIDHKLLLLQLAEGKSEAGKWGVPAGKVESLEAPENAAQRELFEETGISLQHPSQIQHLHSLYIRKPEVDYVFHLCKVQMDQIPKILLSNEHQNYKWASSKDLEEMPLMDGAKEALQHYRASLHEH
jgi:8-oxo-dGTP diphosphatase